MGEIRDYKCKCGYQKRLFIGAGINGCNISAVNRFFPEEAEKFLEEREAGRIQSYLLSNATIHCTHCQELESVPCFTYRTTERMTTCMKEQCPACAAPVIRIHDEQSVKCPKCGLLMEYKQTGLWD